MRRIPILATAAVAAILLAGSARWTPSMSANGQLPLGPARSSGQTITPVYEGWYPNPDGTINLSWGYFNRNTEEAVDVPIGSANQMSPGGPDLGQPTHFLPGRQRGVFAVKMPADFGEGELVWTLDFRGDSMSIPGHTRRDWLLDAVGGAASGNTPPQIGFGSIPEFQGPAGGTAGPFTTTVGQTLELSVNVKDDGISRRSRGDARRANRDESDDGPPAQITLTWTKFRGPGDITFDEDEVELLELEGTATTAATFSEPGDYVAHALVTDIDGVSGNQCCWTNAFVKITVTP